jgi:hypothetical protein
MNIPKRLLCCFNCLVLSAAVADAGQANCVTVGADGRVYTVSEQSGRLMSYDTAGVGTLANKERYFHLYVADWDDDASPEVKKHDPKDPRSLRLIPLRKDHANAPAIVAFALASSPADCRTAPGGRTHRPVGFRVQ